jgi:hypothetical protein
MPEEFPAEVGGRESMLAQSVAKGLTGGAYP